MDYTPSRKINNTGSKKNIGFFPSIKNGRPVAFESHIERDFLYLLEYDKSVLNYYEQPFTINYKHNNQQRRYTPDFLVIRSDKTQVIEVKPYEKYLQIINNEEKKVKYDTGSKYCVSHGYEFKIVTDVEIRSGCFFNNIKYLFAYSRLKVPASKKILVRNYLISSGPSTIATVINELSHNTSDFSTYYSYILSLLYYQDISTDLTTEVSKYSNIWC